MNLTKTISGAALLISMASASAAMVPVQDTMNLVLSGGFDRIEASYVSGSFEFRNPGFSGFADLSITPVYSASWAETAGVHTPAFIQATGNAVGELSFNINGLAEGAYSFHVEAYNGNDMVASGDVTSDSAFTAVVPEPSTYLAGFSALAMLGLFGFKKRQ